MQAYVTRRLVLFIPTLLLASVFVFAVMRILPGDVAAQILSAGGEQAVQEKDLKALRNQMGLDDPLPVQYGSWLWSMIQGKFGGKSLTTRERIGEMIARRLPVTLQLTSYALAMALVVSLPLGIVAALRQDRWQDYLIRVTAIFGLALPNFWLGLMLVLGLAIFLNWSPPPAYVNVWESPSQHLSKVIWPAAIMAWGFAAYLIRMTRATMLEVLHQDYMRTARSKGLTERVVMWRHGLRNCLIPIVTLAGLYLTTLLGGTVVMETVFSVPGIGMAIVQGAETRDYPVVQSMTMVLVFLVLVINLLVDVTYAFIDPRVSYS